MNPGRYFIPNMGMGTITRMGPNMVMGPMIRSGYLATRSPGLINRVLSGLRSFNWRGLVSGANRTLNVVNQTIPLIRQARPMVNNVKSIWQLARAFGNETGNKRSNNLIDKNNNSTNANNISNNNPLNSKNETLKEEISDSNYPKFFI